MSTVRTEISAPLVDALTAPDGLRFCRALRRWYYEELQSGHVADPRDPEERPFIQRAVALDLLEARAPGRFRMTPIGYEIGNVAKEFANWMDTDRQLPEGVVAAMLAGKRVLDVGCGFGRHLFGFHMRDATVVGIDFQHNYLRLSRVFAAQQGLTPPPVSRARAEALPFQARSFDVVFCRLVINYVPDIDHTIGEFVRVLTPRGLLLLTVEPLEGPIRTLLTSKWIGNGNTIAFTLFGLLNTMIVELGGRQLMVRRSGRMHAQHSPAWPTARWISRRLAAHGFEPVTGEAFRLNEYAGVYQGRLTR